MTRKDNVLDLKITLVNIMQRSFGLSWDSLSKILEEYNILSLIDVSYEQFCSMGEKGILLEIKNFVEKQGGSLS